ncbi:lipopolysaccharide biosynthesis protein [Ruminococcus flavefaciens]|uniref:lipopolysaccharide biosynthesis protein n=1 Tax=Ruminococcus flavefaciens TaxID=1265 RepID=UPI0004650C5F|nr:hypothetical protein [Ruminococcus flavefaciens]
MSNSRVKKATYSIVALALYQITVFVCNLILPRLIISKYGSEYNGMVSSITQFLNFVGLLRIGVAGATRVELYKSLGNNDINQTSAIIKATELYMRKIAAIFLGYIILLSIIYPFVINSQYSYLEVASLVIIISIGTFAQYFFGLTYSTLLQADQKLYIYNVIQIVATVLNTIIACALIYRGFSIQIVKFGSAMIYTLSPIVLNIVVSKHYHLNKKVTPDNTALSKKRDVAAQSIANIVHENTDVTVLTVLTDMKTVSVYAVYNLVINGLKQLTNIFTSGLESAFGDMIVKKQRESLYKNLRLFDFLMNCFVMVAFSCALVLVIPFVKIYTKGVTDVQYIIPSYAYIAILSLAIYCLRIPFLTVVHAAGHYKETKKAAYSEAIINLSLSIVLTTFCGIIGVGIGTLVANIFRTIHYQWYVAMNMLKEIKNINLLKRFLWLIGTFSVIVVVNTIILKNVEFDKWLVWAEMAGLVFLISLVVCIISGGIFYKSDLMNALKLVKRMVSKG